MNDQELEALRSELRVLSPQLLYVTMEGHADRVARCAELRARIEAEEQRRAALSGIDLVESQQQGNVAMIEANRRMAVASEAAAKASADAARWAKWAAIFTPLAALVTAVGTFLSVWRAGK